MLASNGVLYVSYGDEPGPNRMEDGAVWKLDTESGAWTDITPEKPGEIKFGYGSLAVDPKNPDRLYATTFCHWAGGDRIYLSLDGGGKWTDISPGTKRDASSTPYLEWGRGQAGIGHWIADIEINPFNPDQVLYTTGATIWASSDATKGDTGGETHWTPLIEGFEETVISDLVSPPSGAPLLSALWDLDGFRHEDLSVSPKGGSFSPNYTHTTSIDFAEKDPNIVVRVHNPQDGSKGGSVSRDNGVTWKGFPSAPEGNGKGRGQVAVAADGSRIVWTPEEASRTFVSKDMGATWTKCEGLPRALPVDFGPGEPPGVLRLRPRCEVALRKRRRREPFHLVVLRRSGRRVPADSSRAWKGRPACAGHRERALPIRHREKNLHGKSPAPGLLPIGLASAKRRRARISPRSSCAGGLPGHTDFIARTTRARAGRGSMTTGISSTRSRP